MIITIIIIIMIIMELRAFGGWRAAWKDDAVMVQSLRQRCW